ncbi:MAG: amidohydrolase family protein, partial [Chloroflexi bacterium]|nr:amidohydrolase family protein [Chloroflexota bacterium]
EYCAADRDRLIGLGVIPWTGIADALAELERCARMGLRGVHVGVFPGGKGYPTPEDDRFWAAAIEMQMPVAVHEEFDRTGSRAGPVLSYTGEFREVADRLGSVRELGFQVSKFARLGGVNAVQLTLAGVFDRFPDLKIFFAETQIGWIPYFLEMADVRYERHLHWAEDLYGFKPLKALPSEYIREHCSWGFQHDFFGVKSRHDIGVDRLMWAIDFPHQDSEWPMSMELVGHMFAGVSAAEKEQMVCRNAVEYFRLEEASASPAPARAAVGPG